MIKKNIGIKMKIKLSLIAMMFMTSINVHAVSADKDAKICEEDQGGTWVFHEDTKKWQCDGVDEGKIKSAEALKRVPKYEQNYLKEYEKIKKTSSQKTKIAWVQPKNKTMPCKVYVEYQDEDPRKDDSYSLFWDGDCKDGYAYGLGREIEHANLTDAWQIGIYKKGKAQDYRITNNILHGFLIEGTANYDVAGYYGVTREVIDNNTNFDVILHAGFMDIDNTTPSLWMDASPLWNGFYAFVKAYPNFRYVYTNNAKDDLSKQEFEFYLENDKGNRHGWYIGKEKDKDIVNAEYSNGEWTIVTLPQEYLDKADKIIKEIEEAKNKALEAQAKAQLVKKQYIKKICKDSVKVDFMDNDEYKEICEDKYEKTLMEKIEQRYKKFQEEKPALLQKMKEEEQQQQEQPTETLQQ